MSSACTSMARGWVTQTFWTDLKATSKSSYLLVHRKQAQLPDETAAPSKCLGRLHNLGLEFRVALREPRVIERVVLALSLNAVPCSREIPSKPQPVLDQPHARIIVCSSSSCSSSSGGSGSSSGSSSALNRNCQAHVQPNHRTHLKKQIGHLLEQYQDCHTCTHTIRPCPQHRVHDTFNNKNITSTALAQHSHGMPCVCAYV